MTLPLELPLPAWPTPYTDRVYCVLELSRGTVQSSCAPSPRDSAPTQRHWEMKGAVKSMIKYRIGGVPSRGRVKERVSESGEAERRIGVEGALRGAGGRRRGMKIFN